MILIIINMGVAGGHMIYASGSQPGVRQPPEGHGKISRGTWMSIELSCIAIF